MKHIKILTAILAFVSSLSLASPEGPRVVGNGGGGLHKNGVYQTFFSAGFFSESVPTDDIPGLELLENTLMQLGGSPSTIAKTLELILPSTNRSYFKVVDSSFDDKTKARLIEEYSRISNQPSETLTLFAITDSNARNTFLLPSFYQLNETEQAAILFHEAVWIVKKDKSNYLSVVTAEVAFQRYLSFKEQGKYDRQLAYVLSDLFRDPLLPLMAALNFDRKNGILNKYDFKNDNKIPASFFERITKLRTFLYTNSRNGQENKKAENYLGEKYRSWMKEYEFDIWAKYDLANIDEKNLNAILVLKNETPESHFISELVKFIAAGYKFQLESRSYQAQIVTKGPFSYFETKEELIKRSESLFRSSTYDLSQSRYEKLNSGPFYTLY